MRHDLKSPSELTTLNIQTAPARIRRPKHSREYENAAKPFVAWDGEATKDSGYYLLGCSAASPLVSDLGTNLTTLEMLSYIIGVGHERRNVFHVSFSFDYDVNNILCDVPWPKLIVLYVTGQMIWNGYRIRHMPRKIFSVTYKDVTVRIDDTFSFYTSRFDSALEKYDIGTAEEREAITKDKNKRADFWDKDRDEITEYNALELRTLVELMNRNRADLNSAGFFISKWHGPGAVANHVLKRHNVKKYKKTTPEEISYASRVAFAGGWFDRFKFGVYEGSLWTADINSAYAYALSQVPDLSSGSWRHIVNPDEARADARHRRMGLYRIHWKHSSSAYFAACHGLPFPLVTRDKNGICHPPTGNGWFHAPEAKLVAGSADYEFGEAWVYEDDGNSPLAWIADMFAERLHMKAEGNPAEKGLKTALASLYGKTAQRTGWDKANNLPPTWHQLEWAGHVTSKCRQMIYTAARQIANQSNGKALVSIDTDGLLATEPPVGLMNGEGEQLGQWKIENYSGLVYIQNGFYWLRKSDGTWDKPKTRGIARGTISTPEEAKLALSRKEKFHTQKRTFVGYGAALRSGHREKWREWIDVPYYIDPAVSGGRVHSPVLCRTCNSGNLGYDTGLHDLATPRFVGVGTPHRLPWLEKRDEEKLITELMREKEIYEEFI